MERLTDEEVLKVLKLAKLDKDIENIEELSYQLKQILDEVDKIEKLDIDNDTDILIAPSINSNVYYDDVVGSMLSKSEVLKNAPKHDLSYVEVVGVLND